MPEDFAQAHIEKETARVLQELMQRAEKKQAGHQADTPCEDWFSTTSLRMRASMTITNLGHVAIKCPACGNTQLSKGNTPETSDTATCGSCGERFSLQAEIDKIGEALKKGLGDAIRKTFKK